MIEGLDALLELTAKLGFGNLWLTEISDLSIFTPTLSARFIMIESVSSSFVRGMPLISKQSRRPYCLRSSLAVLSEATSWFNLATSEFKNRLASVRFLLLPSNSLTFLFIYYLLLRNDSEDITSVSLSSTGLNFLSKTSSRSLELILSISQTERYTKMKHNLHSINQNT